MKESSNIVIGDLTFTFWPDDEAESKRLAGLCQTAYDNELTNMVSRSSEKQYLLVDSPTNWYCIVPIVKFFKTCGMDMVVCESLGEASGNLYAVYHFETGLRATIKNTASIEAAKRQTRKIIKKYGIDAVTDVISARKRSNVTNVLIK